MSQILYCFISHNPVIYDDIITIPKMMNLLQYDNYIIVYGGNKENINHNKVVNLECEDDYCSLPSKTNILFKYVVSNHQQYTHYAKIDRSTVIKKLYDRNIPDYAGRINFLESKRFHFNKCPLESFWYNKIFEHPPIAYCSGPIYFVSNFAAKYIAEDNNLYKKHVYEDCYVGSLLESKNIFPSTISLRSYFNDPSHPLVFSY